MDDDGPKDSSTARPCRLAVCRAAFDYTRIGKERKIKTVRYPVVHKIKLKLNATALVKKHYFYKAKFKNNIRLPLLTGQVVINNNNSRAATGADKHFPLNTHTSRQLRRRSTTNSRDGGYDVTLVCFI